MKTVIFTLALSIISILSFSQSRECFNFQGYAVDNNGKALNAAEIVIKVTVSGTKSGLSQTFVETHSAISTDAYGVFSTSIGCGTKSTSESTHSFNELFFGTIDFNLKVEVKKSGESDGSYSAIYDGTLLTVPYARTAGNGVPVGTVISFAGPEANIPDGYLVCNGAAYSKDDYPALFTAISNYWGGSTATPNLPDLRGMFLRGVNSGRSDGYKDPDVTARAANGKNEKDEVGSTQSDQTASHKHSGSSASAGAHKHNNDGGGYAFSDGYKTSESTDNSSGESNLHYRKTHHSAGSHSHTITIGNTGGNETRPNNAYVLYIIRAY